MSILQSRISIFAMALAAVVTVIALAVKAQEQSPPSTAPAREQSLSRNMSAMGRAWRIVKANARDKTKLDVTLAALGQFEAATVASKQQVPSAVLKMEGNEKTKQLHSYRESMAKLLRQELDLEDQLLAGDIDKASATIAAIDEAEKVGHKDFKVAN